MTTLTAPTPRTEPAPIFPPPLPTAPLEWCRLDERKFSYLDWWRQMRSPLVVIGWAAKLFRVSILSDVRVPRILDWRALEIPAAALTAVECAKLGAKVEEFTDAGFVAPSYMRMENPFNGNVLTAATLRHCESRSIARASLCRPLPGQPGKEEVDVGVISMLADGRFVSTGRSRAKFQQPAWHVEVVARGSAESLLAAHEAQIEGLDAAVRPVRTPEEARALAADYERELFDFHRERGLYVPLTPDQAGRDREECAAVAEGDPLVAATLEELQKQQNHRASWKTGVLLLALSLVAVWSFGQVEQRAERLALLVGILFFHELGHYAAMRLFGFRDLRMFFIPFLGAAVSGRHHNVPGWRKAIVSLAGPVPGIFAGAALAAYAIYAGSDTLAEAALFLVGLNAFNLLPVLPLDGGWFWNSVLFCRHRVLEAGFKVLTGLACIAADFADLGKVWFYLGIVMIVSSVAAWRQCGIVARLRRSGCHALPEGDDALPEETARQIIGAAREAEPKKKQQAKALATETLAIFERLNTRAPNWLETLGLTAIYAISLLVAIVSCSLALIFSRGLDLKGGSPTPAILDATATSSHAPVLDTPFHGVAQRWPAEALDSVPRRDGFFRFAGESEAARAFEATRGEMKPTETLVQFGAWIIASTAARDEQRRAALSTAIVARGGTALDHAGNAGSPMLDLRFHAPDAATAARWFADYDVFLRVPAPFRAAPPWQLDPERQTAVTKAGKTYLQILDAERRAGEDPAVRRIARQQLVRGMFSPLETQIESWKQTNAEKRRIAGHSVRQWLAAADPKLDRSVAKQWLAQPAIGASEDTEWTKQLRRLLTQSDTEDDWIAAEIYGGEATSDGVQVTLTGLFLRDPHRTLPDLARHLAQIGAVEIQYGFSLQEFPASSDVEEDE